MMRRGPLATNPVDTLLETAASERTNGIIELHGVHDGAVYFVEGEVYLADLADQPPLETRMVAAGVLTRDQVETHSEPGEAGMYLAFALDTDESIDEHAIGDFLFEHTAATVGQLLSLTDGEYELDPYGTHPIGILMSWPVHDVLDRARTLHEEAERMEAERVAEAERVEAERVADEARIAEEAAEAERAAGEARIAEEAAEAERVEAERVDAAQTDAAESGEDAQEENADQPIDVVGTQEPESTDKFADVATLVVTSDEPPEGTETVTLTPTEWRVVVFAAQGTSLADIARRLDADITEIQGVVSALCDRGLLATVG